MKNAEQQLCGPGTAALPPQVSEPPATTRCRKLNDLPENKKEVKYVYVPSLTSHFPYAYVDGTAPLYGAGAGFDAVCLG